MEVSDEMQVQAKALADPSRFRLFRFIEAAGGAVGVAELTDLLGFNHNAIRQHLAVLVEANLVAETNEERKVRGRPRKQYTARSDALSAFRSVSGSYEQLASMLLEVTAGAAPYEVGFLAAADSSARGDSSVFHGLMTKLATEGFEPRDDGDGGLALMHCPFAGVAAQGQGVVCELHRGMIDGHLAAHDPDLTAELIPQDPHQAGCRVNLNRSVPVDIAKTDT